MPHLRRTLLLVFLLLPAAWSEIEPKRPLSPEQELKVSREAGSVVVSGETFSYTFDGANGLIRAIRVLGAEITGSAPLPDLVAAEHLNPDDSPYAARNERQARLRVVSAEPSRVVVASEGQYVGQDGKRFPIRYSITYDISIDGVVLVSVSNLALEDCSLRWLTLSAGAIRSDMAQFINWMPEQSTSQFSHYQFRPLAEITGKQILAGTWLPWIWLGNQRVGLEVTTWDVGSQSFNRVDSTARTDEPDMFTVTRTDAGVRWDNYLIRRTRIFARAGWTRSGQFALAVTPSKKFDPYYAMLKGAHLGPHQHERRLTLPDEPQIRTLARNGYNLVVGLANWRSGEYVPLNDADLRRAIALCHKYGMKVIPYMTLVDLSHATQAWREHGEEWAIEPTTEFAQLPMVRRPDLKVEMAWRNDPERETTLMCPGAPGWREFWKRQVDRVIRDYDFDGIYFDFWYQRMVCENVRHGCGGRFRKATVLGSREMLMYAYNRLKAKNPHAVIKANTNTLATALITSLVDIRLVGESTNAAKMDPASRQWLYTSHRLGEPTEMLWDNTAWDAARKSAFATLVNFLPQYYFRPRFEPRKDFDDFDVYRSFDDGSGSWHIGIGGQERLKAVPAEVATNVVERDGALLATLINTRDAGTTAELPVPERWLACEPLTGRWLDPAGSGLKVELGGGAYRHLLLLPKPSAPRLVYSLGSRTPARVTLDGTARRMRIGVDAAPGASIRFAVFSPQPVRQVTCGAGCAIDFTWNPETHVAAFTHEHTPGDMLEVRY